MVRGSEEGVLFRLGDVAGPDLVVLAREARGTGGTSAYNSYEFIQHAGGDIDGDVEMSMEMVHARRRVQNLVDIQLRWMWGHCVSTVQALYVVRIYFEMEAPFSGNRDLNFPNITRQKSQEERQLQVYVTVNLQCQVSASRITSGGEMHLYVQRHTPVPVMAVSFADQPLNRSSAQI